MLKSSRVINAVPIFYGWVILVVGTLGTIMMGPSQTFTVALFITIFIRELGLSRSTVSLIYGLASFSASMFLPITGRWVDYYGPRRMALGVSACLGMACLGMGQVNGAMTLFIGMFAIRFLGFGSLQLISNNVIAQWFIRKRGIVMGISGQSLAFGLVIFPALTQYLISQLGWRGAWGVLGVFVWLIMLPVVWLFFRDKPEQYGLVPDGETLESLQRRDPTAQFTIEDNWTLAEARRTGVFWLFAIAVSNMTMITAGLMFHQLSLFEVRGLSEQSAITAFQVIAFFSIIGNLGVGRLLDKLSARFVLTLVLGVQIADILLLQVMSTPLQGMLYAALMGLMSGSYRVIDATVWAKYFGRQHLGSIRGATMIGVVGSTAFGPYLLGFSYDYFGSYNPLLNTLLLIPLTICALAGFVKRPQKLGIRN